MIDKTKPYVSIKVPATGLAEGTATVAVEAKNHSGDGCVLAVKELTDAIGGVKTERHTSDYYNKPDEQTQLGKASW